MGFQEGFDTPKTSKTWIMIWRQNPIHFLGRYTNHGIMPGSALTSLGNKDPREHWGKSWATCSQPVPQTLWCRRTAQSISGLYTVISYIPVVVRVISKFISYISKLWRFLRSIVFLANPLHRSPMVVDVVACQVHNFSRIKMKSLNAELSGLSADLQEFGRCRTAILQWFAVIEVIHPKSWEILFGSICLGVFCKPLFGGPFLGGFREANGREKQSLLESARWKLRLQPAKQELADLRKKSMKKLLVSTFSPVGAPVWAWRSEFQVQVHPCCPSCRDW